MKKNDSFESSAFVTINYYVRKYETIFLYHIDSVKPLIKSNRIKYVEFLAFPGWNLHDVIASTTMQNTQQNE